MRSSDDIFTVLEKVLTEEQEPNASPRPSETTRSRPVSRKPIKKLRSEERIEIIGYPIYQPLKWDDMGLGMVRSMGFLPTRAVHIEVTKDRWVLTGARANMPVLVSIAAGAGGLLVFLQDLLRMVEKEWGTFSQIGSLVIVLLPLIINLMTRTSRLEIYPFEVEFLGYDSKTQLLILSTLTQPGGLLAMRIDMPAGEKARKIEEARFMEKLNKVHRGFTRIDGQAVPDMSRLQTWSLWSLIWLVVWWIYFTFGKGTP